jgi:hypothetical protein
VAESRLVQTCGRIVLFLALVALLGAPALGPPLGPALFVAASLVVPGALLLSSLPPAGGRGHRVAAALILTVLLEGGAFALLEARDAPWAPWIMLGALGLAPLVVVPLLHATERP